MQSSYLTIIAVHKPGIAEYFIPRKTKYPTLPGFE